MLKKITLSLMVSALCIQQSFAGTGSSTPLKEEQENRPIRRVIPTERTIPVQRSTPPHNRNDDRDAIVTGLAGLAIGGALIYGLYKASQDSETSHKPSPQNFQDIEPRQTGERTAANLNSRKTAPRNYEDDFSYPNENFSEEAWRKANGLPNHFSTLNAQRNHGRSSYTARQTNKEPACNLTSSSSYSASSYSETEDSFDSPPPILQLHKGCPVIDLSDYEETTLESTPIIDLHPVYKGNFKQHLRDELFQKQRAYHLSQTPHRKYYISTGTGKKRPGPNFTLQNAVSQLLKEDYFKRRIEYYRLEKEGFFAIFLRKNIKSIAAK